MPGFSFLILPYQSMDGGANNSIWLDFCNTSSSNRPRASACTLGIAKKLSSALGSLWRFTAAPPHSNYRDNRFTYDIIAVRAPASWRGRGVITTPTFLSLSSSLLLLRLITIAETLSLKLYWPHQLDGMRVTQTTPLF